MKAFLILLLISTQIWADTKISGNIDGISFHPDNNPYIVEKDIIVPKGKVVNIPEDIVFLFNPFSGLRVDGRLNVMGSEEKLVVFTSINEKKFNSESELLPNPFDWNGIFITKEADGAHMNHFSLKYSVYGVKSQCNNIIIQNAMFQQNGQFHFTLNEQIKPVVDNIPFSYTDPQVNNVKVDVSPKQQDIKSSVELTSASSQKQKKKDSRINIIRYTSLGLGVAGGITMAIFASKMNKHSERISKINSTGIGLEEWEKENDMWGKAKNAAIVSGVIAGIGLVGFGVSFAF